jgi:hypothetical protein
MLRLSQLFRDPDLRAAFEAAERDQGEPFVIPAPKPQPTLDGGAYAEREAVPA